MRATNDNDLLAAARVNRSLAWLFAIGYGVLVGIGWYGTVQVASMLRCSTPFDWLGTLLDKCYARNKALGFLVASLIASLCAIGIALILDSSDAVRGVWGA